MKRLIGGSHDGEYFDAPPSFHRIKMLQKGSMETEVYRLMLVCGLECFVIDGMSDKEAIAWLLEHYQPLASTL